MPIDPKINLPPPPKPRATPAGFGGFADEPPPQSKKSFGGKLPRFPRQELRQAGAALWSYARALPVHVKLVVLGAVALVAALVVWAAWPLPTERVAATTLGQRFKYCDVACADDTCRAECSGATEPDDPTPERKRGKRGRRR